MLLENGSRRKHFEKNSLMHIFYVDRHIVHWFVETASKVDLERAADLRFFCGE